MKSEEEDIEIIKIKISKEKEEIDLKDHKDKGNNRNKLRICPNKMMEKLKRISLKDKAEEEDPGKAKNDPLSID